MGKPGTITFKDGDADESYHATVLRVEDFYDDGTPRTFTRMPEGAKIDLAEGSRVFTIAYMSEATLKKRD